jgi:hypothetical protein
LKTWHKTWMAGTSPAMTQNVWNGEGLAAYFIPIFLLAAST